MKYYLLNNSCVICIDDKTYTISHEDYRYEKVKANLISKNFDKVEQLISPTANLNKEGFVVKDGLVFHKDEAIPSCLGDKFLEISNESFEFKSIFNFWMNVKNRTDKEQASEIINELIEKNAYPITEDGFYFVYCNSQIDQTKSALNKKRNLFNFYNYSNCPHDYFTYFNNKTNLDEIIKSIFGFNSKKLKNIVTNRLFATEKNFLNYNVFFYAEAFKNLLNNDNLFYVMENNLLDITAGDISEYRSLNLFFKDYSIEKNGDYSQKKIINFLNSAKNKRNVLDAGIYYAQLKEKINIDFKNINFSNNCEEICEYFKKEIYKLGNKLKVLINAPEVTALSDEEFGDFKILVPKTSYDLQEWGNFMQNCIGNGSYADKVNKKQCKLIGIANKNTNELVYNIEIARNSFVQFVGRGNKPPDKKDKEVIQEFLKSKNLIYKE